MSDVKLAIRKIKSFADVHCPNLNPDVRQDYRTTTQMICGEIQRLTEQLAERDDEYSFARRNNRELIAKNIALKRQNKELRKAFNTYAAHFNACRGGRITGADANGVIIMTTCTCGLDKALQESGNE